MAYLLKEKELRARRARYRKRYDSDPEFRAKILRETAAQYEKRKEFIKHYKETHPCLRCGLEDWRCLDFHHRDRETKSFSIGHSGMSRSLKRIQDEIAKCDVLCANCHRIEEWELSKQKTTPS